VTKEEVSKIILEAGILSMSGKLPETVKLPDVFENENPRIMVRCFAAISKTNICENKICIHRSRHLSDSRCRHGCQIGMNRDGSKVGIPCIPTKISKEDEATLFELEKQLKWDDERCRESI